MNADEINEKIVEKIKNARNEREKTQQDLASELNKTRAAISDMERGKVQVSAGELYIIAKLLDKPIEYFYGEDFSGKEVQDFIAITRLQDASAITDIVKTLKMTMRFHALENKFRKYSKKEDVPISLVKEFYETYLEYSKDMNIKVREVNEMKSYFDKEWKLNENEIAVSKKK